MLDLTLLSNEELISQHSRAWVVWRLARKRFGELGTPDQGEVVTACELEARRRGIPDELLMAAVPEDMR